MKIPTTTTLIAVGVITIVLCASSFTRGIRADEPRRIVNATPAVTLGDGQTLLVSYLNAGGNPFEIIPCIFDADGAHIKTGAVLTLAPGQMRSLELSYAEAVRRTGRANVLARAGVHVDDQNLKSLAVSGEVVDDATAKSTIVIPGVAVGFDPQPDPPGSLATSFLSPVGITFGQRLRVTLINVGSNPFEIIPCIFDSNGAHIKTGDAIALALGETRSLEMSRSEFGGRTEPRVQVYGAAHVANGDLKNLVLAGEVIDETTGRSNLFMPALSWAPEYTRQFTSEQ